MTSPRTLVIATKNAGKFAEFCGLLKPGAWRLVNLTEFVHLPEVVESGSTLAENARIKAAEFAVHANEWTLADDTGLEVDALDGAPGVYSARYAGPHASAEANRRRLLIDLGDTPLERRSARFVCHLALADPAANVRAEAVGHCRGRIRLEPMGDRGFGYDSLFEIIEYRRTLAELGAAATSCLGHRARALQSLWPDLEGLLAS
jgi:XTP/dITP diphosphohydrolase